MQMQGTALAGGTQTFQTKRGDALQKTKLKVLDIGAEASGGVYWVDFLGEAALSDEEMQQVMRQQVEIEVRLVSASPGKPQPGVAGGRAFLNISGGAVRLGGQVVQRSLRGQQQAVGGRQV